MNITHHISPSKVDELEAVVSTIKPPTFWQRLTGSYQLTWEAPPWVKVLRETATEQPDVLDPQSTVALGLKISFDLEKEEASS